MYRMNCHLTDDLSLSARRAWIEISRHLVGVHFGLVALRKESVDRNFTSFKTLRSKSEVALRKESVDRNVDPDADSLTDDVALRKESVDRNMLYDTSSLMKCQSLSARRAWIEMHKGGYYANCDESRSPQGERG